MEAKQGASVSKSRGYDGACQDEPACDGRLGRPATAEGGTREAVISTLHIM